MEILYTIQKEIANNRKLMILIVILCFVLCSLISCFAIYTNMQSKDKIYALDNQNNVIVFNQVREDRSEISINYFSIFRQTEK